MSEIDIRVEGRAGRITLNRPQALNALTYDMILAIMAALDAWRTDDAVALVLIDAQGDRAFCAGGDIADMYRSGTAGDFAYGRAFWRDEYRTNAKLARFAKPVVSFLQGFTMGGGVGVGCHASSRIVTDTSVIAMPECGIGLVPDVGGSLILARSPGHLGAYLGTTTTRLTGPDAIQAGFADHLIAGDDWDGLKSELIATGKTDAIAAAASPEARQPGTLPARRQWIDRHFCGDTLAEILASLRAVSGDALDEKNFADAALTSMAKNSPLSMACTVKMMCRLRPPGTRIEDALALEYRFTARAMQQGDFLEGIRAAIIDKDRTPRWRHGLDDVTETEVAAMLAPLEQELTL